MPSEPFHAAQVKALVLASLDANEVFFAPHALEEMDNDGITTADAEAVLRGGKVMWHDLRSGTWRYVIRNLDTSVVVTFRGHTVVVTAWRR